MERKISVVINTYNASEHLEEVVESVKGFDEIVVCDMESTDGTAELAGRLGCKVLSVKKNGYTIVEPMRNVAIQAASCPWVLVVDADELVTKELREYLYAAIAKPDCPAGLYVPRKNFYLGEFNRSSYPDYQLRFMKREGVEWPPYIHSRPVVNGKVDKIPSSQEELAFVHLNVDISSTISKLDRYSDCEVEKHKDDNTSIFAMVFLPTFRFFKYYFLKGGFLCGRRGLIYAVEKANYKFYTICKVWESKQNEGK